MKYKVGDKVRVRNDLIEGKSYGGYLFTEAMTELKGQLVTIEELFKCDGGYFIEETNYIWTDEMFEDNIEDSKSGTKYHGVKVKILSPVDYFTCLDFEIASTEGGLLIIDKGKNRNNYIFYYNGVYGSASSNYGYKSGYMSGAKDKDIEAGIRDGKIVVIGAVNIDNQKNNKIADTSQQKGNKEMNNPKSLNNTDKVKYSKLTEVEQKAYKNNLINLDRVLTDEGNNMILENMSKEEKMKQTELIVDILEKVNAE